MFPLQVPGGPELLLIGLLGLLIAAGVAYWVYQDAQSRNVDNATAWAVATLAGGLLFSLVGLALVVVLYLVVGRD